MNAQLAATQPAAVQPAAARPALLDVARLVHSIRYEDLPAEVVQRAKALLLDTLACACGGAASGTSHKVLQVVQELGGSHQASVIGSGLKTSMPMAALANGTMVRYMDANDYYFGRDPAHPSGNIATLLAVGEKHGTSGKEFIACMVAAYELQIRLCDAAGEPSLWSRGWHHSTNAVFAASALSARMMGCSEEATAHAMAIAASHQNTLAALQSGEVSQIKSTAEAWAGKAGIEAAMLAVAGITGPLHLLEAKNGWADAVAGKLDVQRLTAPVDGHYKLMQACTKPYPAVASAMAVIEAGIALRAQLGLDSHLSNELAGLQRIVVSLPAYVLGTPAASAGRRHPATKESAEHSLYFCAALALHAGECTESDFGRANLDSPLMALLLDRIELAEDAELSQGWPARAGAAVSITLADGRTLTHRCPAPPGHPDNPMSAQALADKFNRHASGLFTAPQRERLRALVASLEDVGDVGELGAALSSTGAEHNLARTIHVEHH